MVRGTHPGPRRAGACIVLAALLLSLSARAAERAVEAARPPMPLAHAAQTHAERADLGLALQDAGAPPVSEGSGKPFFKTRRGVVSAVLMGAGLAWVLYSKSHDRVRSPANP